VLSPWPTAAVLAVLARRPAVAAGAYGTAVVLLARRLRALPAPPTQALATVAAGVGQTWLGLGRSTDQFAWPAVLVALAGSGPGPSGRRLGLRVAPAGLGPGPRGRRLALLALLVTPPLVEWWRRRPALNPLRFVAGYLADEAAYGLGVYRGCVRHRTWAPLRPRLLVGRSGDSLLRSAWRRPPAAPPLPNSSSSTPS
jgi:mycofactocin glycosyltransferase